jgi:hypothetical protein
LIEIYFSIIQRKVLAPNDLHDLDAVAERIIAFQDYWPEFESWGGFRGSVRADFAVSGRLAAF